MGTEVLPCPEDSVLLTFFLTSAFYNLSLLSRWSLELGEVMWHTCPICDWWFPSPGVSALWPFISVWINHLLHKTYLMGSESCTNLWVEWDKSLKNSLMPCSFSKIIIIGLLPGLMNSPAMSSWTDLHFQVCVFCYGISLSCLLVSAVAAPESHSFNCGFTISVPLLRPEPKGTSASSCKCLRLCSQI